jgi:HK97 family phage portal protein
MEKKQRRSLFNILFGPKPAAPPGTATQLRMLNGYSPVFTAFGQEAYDSDDVRAAVDAVARNVAKLHPKHVRKDAKGNITAVSDNLQYLLDTRPNPYMDTYTFLYKVTTQLLMQNNAFIFVQYDGAGNVTGMYPIPFSNIQLIESGGTVYAKFSFTGGDNVTIEYTELIHLRRFFYRNDIYGEPNMQALGLTLDTISTADQGVANAVKSSNALRGILKSSNTLKENDLKSRKDRFVRDYMTISEGTSGVAALDNTMEYKELTSDPQQVNAITMKFLTDKVYRYFGVSEPIISSSFTEDQWNAFYESTIEPIAIQMSLQFTATLFSTREQQFGNQIIFEANRLEYASASTKINMARNVFPTGLFTYNEMRQMFNMAPLDGPDGDKRIVSLNFIDAKKANQYQVGENDGAEPPDTPQEGDNQNEE